MAGRRCSPGDGATVASPCSHSPRPRIFGATSRSAPDTVAPTHKTPGERFPRAFFPVSGKVPQRESVYHDHWACQSVVLSDTNRNRSHHP